MRIQRRVGRGKILLLVFLALCVGLITLDFRSNDGGVLEGAKDVTAAVVEPIQRGFTAIFRPIGNIFSSIGELGSLRSENARLESEVTRLREQVIQAQGVLEENESLKALFDLNESWASMDKVTAEIISKVPSNYQWAYTISKGTSDGVREDMTVINDKGLVGKIIEVQDSTSTVLLLIDPRGAAGAKLEGKEYSGTITGNGAGEPLSLEFIGIDAPVELGDAVQTSYLGGTIFPPNIPIGLVIKVEGESAATEQTIEVQPYVDFTRLDFVQVLIESGPNARGGN